MTECVIVREAVRLAGRQAGREGERESVCVCVEEGGGGIAGLRTSKRGSMIAGEAVIVIE